jgi:PPOX class probable F420-dependent enzyme
MPGGSCSTLNELPARSMAIVRDSDRAVLATVDGNHRPHAVPVCWAEIDGRIAVAIDDKPKTSRRLQRVRNIERNPDVTLLFDHYENDWEQIGWVMVRARASLAPPGTARAELAQRYEQYSVSPPAGEVIVATPQRIVWWNFK